MFLRADVTKLLQASSCQHRVAEGYPRWSCRILFGPNQPPELVLLDFPFSFHLPYDLFFITWTLRYLFAKSCSAGFHFFSFFGFANTFLFAFTAWFVFWPWLLRLLDCDWISNWLVVTLILRVFAVLHWFRTLALGHLVAVCVCQAFRRDLVSFFNQPNWDLLFYACPVIVEVFWLSFRVVCFLLAWIPVGLAELRSHSSCELGFSLWLEDLFWMFGNFGCFH